jgi:predicted secreted Zn-dependent protease
MKYMRDIERWAAGGVLACACLSAHAAVITGDTVGHYPISGASDTELRREMNAKGPSGSGGRRFDAYTRWNISWRYTYREAGGVCRIDTVTTDVKVTMTLPEWRDERTAPEQLRKRWSAYVTALTAHEMGHRNNGLEAAREIDSGIGAMTHTSCNALGNAANALGNQILRKYNERDLDYDRSTDHGRTQGARFP